MLFFVLLLLLVPSAALAIKLDKRIEAVLFPWIISIIVILYIFGYFGILKYGNYFIIMISCVSLVYFIYRFVKNVSFVSKRVLTPGLLAFLVLFAFSIFVTSKRVFTVWDEFSHWGLCVKNMFYLDNFYTASGTTAKFLGYPPGTALFQYFFTKMGGSFRESYLMTANNVIIFSVLVSFIKNYNWKNFYFGFTTVLICGLVSVFFYPKIFTSIYVDAVLGLLLAYILLTYFTNKHSKFVVISISLAVFMLTIVKSSGTGLAILGIIIILSDTIFIKKINIFSIKNIKGNFNSTLIVFIPIVALVIGKLSWSMYLNIHNLTEAWNTSNITFGNIIDIINGNCPSYQLSVLNNFFNYFFKNPTASNSINLSYFVLLTIVTCSIIINSFLVQDKVYSKRMKLLAILIFIEGVIYAIALLILYLFTYSEYEATRLASIDRYLNTYLICSVLTAILLFLECSNKIKKLKYLPLLLVIILLASLNITTLKNYTISARNSANQTVNTRNQYSCIELITDKIDSKEDKIYFISIASKGYDYWVAKYLLTPIHIQGTNNPWSIGSSPYFDGDIWTKKINVESFVDTLLRENFKYVYIYSTNQEFNKYYGSIFENGVCYSETLYKIDTSGPNFMLIPIH